MLSAAAALAAVARRISSRQIAMPQCQLGGRRAASQQSVGPALTHLACGRVGIAGGAWQRQRSASAAVSCRPECFASHRQRTAAALARRPPRDARGRLATLPGFKNAPRRHGNGDAARQMPALAAAVLAAARQLRCFDSAGADRHCCAERNGPVAPAGIVPRHK